MDKLKDITEKYIRDNFDIDKERKTKKIINHYDLHIFDFGDFLPFTQYCKDESKSFSNVKEIIDSLENAMNDVISDFSKRGYQLDKIKHEHRAGCEMLGESDSSMFVLYFYKNETETDKQVINRLKSREKQKIKKKMEKEKKEEKELKEFERLKKKFGENYK